MRTVHLLVLLAAPALIALVPASPVEAGDCNSGYYGHQGGRVSCNSSGTCYVRDRCHPSTRYVVPRHRHVLRGSDCGCSNGYVRPSYGAWSGMRRHMSGRRGAIRRFHVRNYFLRRYPFCLKQGETIDEAARVDVLLAIGDENAGSGRVLDDQGLLDRGAARFHVADYAGAKADFVAALAKNPKEHRARLGLLMVKVVTSDWRGALAELDTLAKAGELRAEDRIETESVFAEATKLKTLTDTLKDTVGYRMNDARAHTVTAWLLAGQGDTAGAKRFVRLATRYGGRSPARDALAANLGLTKKAAPQATPAKSKPAPKAGDSTPAGPQVKPKNPALHRELAQATRRGA